MSTSIDINDESQYSLLNPSSNHNQASRIELTRRYRIVRTTSITFLSLLILFLFYKLGQYSKSNYTPSTNTSSIVKQIQHNVTNTILQSIDHNINPCDDFYQFACGGWLSSDSAAIPDDKSSIDIVMHGIDIDTTNTLHSILTSSEQWPMISEFYNLCMNTDNIDSAGIPDTLTHQLHQIDELSIIYAELNHTLPFTLIFTMIAELHLLNSDVLFSFGSGADIMNPTMNIAQLSQGGLTLPDITYYTNTDHDSIILRDKYKQHISTMLQLVGGYSESNSNRYADDVIQLEILIAQHSQAEVELRNITATYNTMDLNEFLQLTHKYIPNITWLSYLQSLGLYPAADPTQFIINIQSIQWLIELCQLINTIDIDQLQSYLRWHTIHNVATLLPSHVVHENFQFFGTELNGVTTQLPRYKQCIHSVDIHLGQLLGRYYVTQVFDIQSKQLALQLMHNVVQAMNRKLQSVQWLDESTRTHAINKLSLLHEQIGYPDKWEQYIGLVMLHQSYYNDVINSIQWSINKNIQSIGKSVDTDEWYMTTPTINAYYEPTMNGIVLPAGILTGLYFNKYYHPAINYGNTATTMGHELSHAFDDQGSQFDGSGKFSNWWSDSVHAAWNQRTQCISDWYSQYEVLPGIHLDGELTCGENIADVAGIKQSYTAYQNYMLHSSSNDNDTIQLDGIDIHDNYIDGYTNDQLFFISYAQGWCSHSRDELARLRVLIDPHSDSRSRVNGPVTQYNEFSRVFQCKQGDAMMLPEDKICDVW